MLERQAVNGVIAGVGAAVDHRMDARRAQAARRVGAEPDVHLHGVALVGGDHRLFPRRRSCARRPVSRASLATWPEVW